MEIFKTVKTEASKEFEKLLDTQFSKTQSLVEGKIIEGVITKITEKFVFLDCGLKSEPILDINELKTIGRTPFLDFLCPHWWKRASSGPLAKCGMDPVCRLVVRG